MLRSYRDIPKGCCRWQRLTEELPRRPDDPPVFTGPEGDEQEVAVPAPPSKRFSWAFGFAGKSWRGEARSEQTALMARTIAIGDALQRTFGPARRGAVGAPVFGGRR